jgi:hypothetical protein
MILLIDSPSSITVLWADKRAELTTRSRINAVRLIKCSVQDAGSGLGKLRTNNAIIKLQDIIIHA